MKRTGTLCVTAAIAVLTVVAVPNASAADDDMPKKSSEITGTGWVYAKMNESLGNENTSSIQPWADEYKRDGNITDYFMDGHPGKVIESSVANDAANRWTLGTTMDIILGTGIAALVLALAAGAYNAGVIQLP